MSERDFDSQKIQQELNACLDNKRLDAYLNSLWARFVPSVLCISEQGELKRQLEKILLNPLERYLTACSNPSEKFEELKKTDDPPLLCAKAFRNGDPTYSCRDCAVDPTCVLCMQCFEKSAHRKHKYKISTSTGGGYCDCGDIDAWKSDHACSIHDKVSHATNQHPEDRLPVDFKLRAELLFDKVLKYSFLLLTHTENSPLPDELRPCSEELNKDHYYTMLFNDEVHTYDQVITTLQKAIDSCSSKEAKDFATMVDREGRACVHKGLKEQCNKVAKIIKDKTSRQQNKPLQVQVIHYTVVTHQEFAHRLLKWLETVIGHSDALRSIFCRISMQPYALDDSKSVLEKILLADTKFWKAIRLQCHQLFMAGVFKDLKSKTQFAILFTKHYQAIYADFVRDDHYRSVSATAVTVQIYTVTPVVRLLIEKHRLIEVILRTILTESETWKENGTLVFQRPHDAEKYTIFKRVQFALYDLRYALGCVLPQLEWTEELMMSFLEGFRAFLDFLSQLQGMDSTKRFTAQHIEFEAEWETAFNIQLKLHDCVSLIIKWCVSNQQVLLDAYNMVLRYLPRPELQHQQVTIAGHSADCCFFEVGGADNYTSIHLPLHRLLAGLNNALPDHLGYVSSSFSVHGHKLKLPDLLEHPLRVQVLLGQVQADMWKRNGYSILNQIYYYQYVKCRQEMYDRDIQLIQAVASLMDPNEFIIHLLNKFNLTSIFSGNSNPKSPGFSQKQQNVLLDECLQLLIIILGERFVEGIGQVENSTIVQREIIHQLAISKMSHSDLDKNLAEDPNHETNLEANVRVVADVTRTDSGKIMYSLKPGFYSLFNPCFYHYTKAEQSKAEDSQRVYRRNNGLSQVLSVPIMPRWHSRFANVSALFTCDVMFHIVNSVLFHMVNKKNRVQTESHVEKILHLVTMGFHEDKLLYEQGNKSLPFTKTLQGRKGEEGETTADLLMLCTTTPNITHEPIKDLCRYVLEYYTKMIELSASNDFSRVASTSSLDSLNLSSSSHDKEKEKKAARAEKTRQKIMERMARAQKKFVKENVTLFNSCSEPTLGLKQSASAMELAIPDDEVDAHTVALGSKQSEALLPSDIYVCIVCQEASSVNDGVVVYPAFVQRSTVLSRSRDRRWEDNKSCLFVSCELRSGCYSSTCGHPMHAKCWKIYYDGVVAKEMRNTRGILGLTQRAFNVEMDEFLCPLCDSIANTVLPVLSSHRPYVNKPNQQTFVEWLAAMNHLSTSDDLSEVTPVMAVGDRMQCDGLESDPSIAVLTEEMTAIIKRFLQTITAVFNDQKPRSITSAAAVTEQNAGPLVWNTTAYTIQALEQIIRADGKPLFGHISHRQEAGISLLVRFAAVCHKVLPQGRLISHGIDLLKGLLRSTFSQSASVLADSRVTRDFTILDLDIWHYLVSLCFSLPILSSFSSTSAGSMSEQYLLHLLLSIHITQVLLSRRGKSSAAVYQRSEQSDGLSMEVDDSDSLRDLKKAYSAICITSGMSPIEQSSVELENEVIHAVLPFLRCAAILFRHLTDVPEPPKLRGLLDAREEYKEITLYLALPSSPGELFTDEILSVVLRICQEPNIKQRVSKGQRVLPPSVEYPLRVNQLIELPNDYTELINDASRFTCPNSYADDESRSPALCLVCKEMLCSQSYCCQVEVGSQQSIGAASAHTQHCGAGNSVFLRVRQCQIVFLSGKTKGCFLPAPYVDDYGETDLQLKRGNPMHLCTSAYKDLHRIWLSHGIPEKIARSVVGGSQHLMPDWLNL